MKKNIPKMNVPVTIYTEMTPNPSTMKFVANKYLLISGDSAEFTSRKEAKGFSPIAEALFDFPFVKNVFIADNGIKRIYKRMDFKFKRCFNSNAYSKSTGC
ncbi:MAG: hypothetical protein EBZ94_07470 [Crocinitomicaceae bacterium]|nr:hypothetical protein [Crocinitomicaceae bacterium]